VKQKMKKSLITLTVMLAAAAMVVVFCGTAMAKVEGACGNCHTMHNSQGGNHMMINTTIDGTSGGAHGGGYPALTRGTCVGCHTGANNGSNTTPYVYDPDGVTYGTDTLAGGNFYWVRHDTENKNAKGHNVKGIPGMTADTLTVAPGGFSGCDCHTSLYTMPTVDTGCQGCHREPKHHAPQQAAGTAAVAANGYFRFLSGHNGGTGVHGIEDSDWQYNNSATDHNEYLGDHENTTNTMTGYCVGCHGEFHTQVSGGEWIRHPSDARLPSTGEYTGYTVYDPNVPVARPDLGNIAATESVANNADMVMCLSCHRAHGSPYADLLRWEYDQMVAGDNTKSGGCFVCHTNKNGT
jgi:predicted CXXCH cytochrome family protein